MCRLVAVVLLVASLTMSTDELLATFRSSKSSRQLSPPSSPSWWSPTTWFSPGRARRRRAETDGDDDHTEELTGAAGSGDESEADDATDSDGFENPARASSARGIVPAVPRWNGAWSWLGRPVGMPHHRDMSTSRVGWLGTEVVCECASSFHGPMDEVRRSRPSDRALLAELWRVFPPQPSEPALPAVRRRGLFCQSRSSSRALGCILLGFWLSKEKPQYFTRPPK